uniref:Uncharacterized protein n=1 Tax=Babesia bovis TaxID=5865 RepID=S6BDH2_BABBO|nr:hypothetical protein [Babesia bovis]
MALLACYCNDMINCTRTLYGILGVEPIKPPRMMSIKFPQALHVFASGLSSILKLPTLSLLLVSAIMCASASTTFSMKASTYDENI